MKQLISNVKELSLKAKRSPCHRSFLDGTLRDPNCQQLAKRMGSLTPEQMGIQCEGDCPYHFKGNLNRVTVDGLDSEDYRLVLFFIKKGTKMPLHDHPNMSVFFRMVFGKLSYRSYDKVEEKFKYNDFVDDEYQEILDNKTRILAKKTKLMTLKTDDLLFVRPSQNNMHEFVAEENSCFFDICLPNYTPENHSRRITYFKEINEQADCVHKGLRGGLTELEYDTTPPVMPVNFQVHDLEYRGCFQ